MGRGLHVASSATSHWKSSSSAAAYNALPAGGIRSEDSMLLLVLLCFLAQSEVTPHLFIRGATPRKRWSESGDIEDMDALRVGLAPELVHTLSNDTNLNLALCELQSLGAISRNPNDTYILDPAISAGIVGRLPPELHPFWRLQALVVAFRSFLWKYLEPRPSDMQKLLPHIRHTVLQVRDNEGFHSLASDMRTDLILTLIEASRSPGMSWKRFAIDQAKEVMHGLNDGFLQSCIAQRECILHRITGDIKQAASDINTAPLASTILPIEKKVHAGSGHTAIQRALNHIQVDELATAANVLNAWHPLSQTPSAIEETVLFRKHVLLGKISQYQGRFEESLANLERSKKLADLRGNLFFGEDRCDLMCSLSDTLLELGFPTAAEHHLRSEISRRDKDGTSAEFLLKLSLAESLFAQERYTEAETICSEAQSQEKLLKMEKLRLAIIQAKLSHINFDGEGAICHWTEAMHAISQFTLTHGHTTRIILLSICDILRRQRRHELELKSRDQLATLEKLAGTGGTRYWIAGLRQWLHHLQSPNKPRI